ncbi:hypothetical protein DAPPUDRAFT_253911 [Daphnia pulex]|uniref:Uncharacterized protein n=1 Tax=Daphnia pulex TaxID=6669 RepID=E9H5X8_DAPPU|nr:hypothetical protein DAPPUDRAFT_253911 [Daphnia pulex]|eukprot:EFX72856.1 hypothetical protein DAPPUDRAFT_253911 [Daphnia pulex]
MIAQLIDWIDFAELSQLASSPETEQMTTFCMTLRRHHAARGGGSVGHTAFDERRQGPSEYFDDFYIGLWWLVEAEDLCSMSFLALMTTQPKEVVVVVMAQQPMVFKPPVANQFPVADQFPVAGQPPVACKSPVVGQAPVACKSPGAGQSPVACKPLVADKPLGVDNSFPISQFPDSSTDFLRSAFDSSVIESHYEMKHALYFRGQSISELRLRDAITRSRRARDFLTQVTCHREVQVALRRLVPGYQTGRSNDLK